MLEFLQKGILVHGTGLSSIEFLDSWTKAKAIAMVQDIDVLPGDDRAWMLLYTVKPSEHAKARFFRTIEMSDEWIATQFIGKDPYLVGYWLFEARHWSFVKSLKWLWRHRHD